MLEHYGVDLPASTIKNITELHAKKMEKNQQNIQTLQKKSKASKDTIAEADGAMVPMVTIDAAFKGDKRKTRKTEWREGRVVLAREKGTIKPIYSALIGSPDDVGDHLGQVVHAIGYDENTNLHCIGDGATWIADQVERVFGDNANFLIDFYHLSQYLSEASQCCSSSSREWFHSMQDLMKQNKADVVIKQLEQHMNEDNAIHDCGAKKCYQYMIKRMHQFNYKDALDQNLPIGSGEIESANRTIIQKRLKLSGAWWLENNANAMLKLRVIRANGLWNSYWAQHKNNELSN